MPRPLGACRGRGACRGLRVCRSRGLARPWGHFGAFFCIFRLFLGFFLHFYDTLPLSRFPPGASDFAGRVPPVLLASGLPRGPAQTRKSICVWHYAIMANSGAESGGNRANGPCTAGCTRKSGPGTAGCGASAAGPSPPGRDSTPVTFLTTWCAIYVMACPYVKAQCSTVTVQYRYVNVTCEQRREHTPSSLPCAHFDSAC
jgi:hypothetical protein